MPFCQNCGILDVNDPVYCSQCGKRFSSESKNKKKGRSKKKDSYNDFVITAPAKKKSKPQPQPQGFKTTKFVAVPPPKPRRTKAQKRQAAARQRQKAQAGRTPVAPVYTPAPQPRRQAAPRRAAPRPQPRPQPRQQYYQQPAYQQPRSQPAYQPQRQPAPVYSPPPPPRQAPPPRRSKPKRDKRRKSGSGGMWKTFAAIVVILLIFLALMYVFFVHPEWLDKVRDLSDDIDTDMRMFPEESEFEVKKVFSLSASSPVGSYTLKGASIKNIPADGYRQNVVEFRTTPNPTRTIPDIGENTVLIWQEQGFSGSKTIEIYYHVKSHSYEWDIDGKNSGNKSDIPQNVIDTYTGDSWAVVDDYDYPVDFDGDGKQDYRFNPSNPQIQQIANQVAGNEQNVYKIIKKVYDWVVNNHYYPSPEEMQKDAEKNWNLPKCPLVTIEDEYGDCDDQSFLFGSICRAAGVPVWLVGGALYDMMKEEWVGHGWAEVYIPMKDGGYEIATVDCVNQEFLFRDCFRFTDWVDTGGNITIDGESINNLEYNYMYFSQRSSRQSRGSADVDAGFVGISFDSSGMINKPIDGPGGKYILPGLNADPDSAGIEAPIIVSTLAVSLVLIAVISRRRRS